MILLPSHMYRRLQQLFSTCRSPQEGQPVHLSMAVVLRGAPDHPPPAGRQPQLRPSRQIWPWARYRPPGTESSCFGWECLWQARFSVSHSSHKGEPLSVVCLWGRQGSPYLSVGGFLFCDSCQSIKALATIAGEQDSERASYYSIPGARVFWQQGLPDGDHDGA
jgi:hypothetical protein